MRRRLLILMICGTALSMSGALAQEHRQPVKSAAPSSHEADASSERSHGPKYELLTVDGMTAVWTIIIFVILLVILRTAAWKPVQKVLIEREKYIHESLQQAKKEREQAEARLAEYLAKLNAARTEATAIVEEGRRDAEVVKRRIEDEAKSEAKAILERGKREIAIATDTAVKELYTLSGKLATEVAGRILRKELNPLEHERLITESINELQEVEAS